MRASHGEFFVAPLLGRAEVPPVDSNDAGVALFKLRADGSSIDYLLIVANIEDVTQAHIHLAPAGSNGGVVAFLYGGPTVSPNGILARGTIAAGDLIGSLAGATIADLVAEMAAGDAYVNVHTLVHPGGEIRGQIR